MPAVRYEGIVQRVLDKADVRAMRVSEGVGAAVPSGARPWDIRVVDPRFFKRVLLGGSLALGESYMDGWWTCDDVIELVRRLKRSDVEQAGSYAASALSLQTVTRLMNRQSRRDAQAAAAFHYNLDTELFGFLGKHVNYSSGYFQNTDDLDEAQILKLELICRKLNLSQGDRVADIGGGWGEFARYAAERYGCRVTSINVADGQIAFAREHCKGLPVEVIKCDYRDLRGTYDKIAAIAMIAHVGHRNYRTFMRVMHDHLTPDGVMLIETVGCNAPVATSDPWIDRYIFPRGMVPALPQMTRSMDGLFVLEDLHNFGPHYVKTLKAWRRNFEARWPHHAGRYDERTHRMFTYFFDVCAGTFAARSIQYWHLLMTRVGAPQPPCPRAA